jgi:hypothetical protein
MRVKTNLLRLKAGIWATRLFPESLLFNRFSKRPFFPKADEIMRHEAVTGFPVLCYLFFFTHPCRVIVATSATLSDGPFAAPAKRFLKEQGIKQAVIITF